MLTALVGVLVLVGIAKLAGSARSRTADSAPGGATRADAKHADPTRRRLTLIAILAVLVLGALYFNNALDKPLSSLGLNHSTCATTLLRGKLCGDDLVLFCRAFHNGHDGTVCDQVLADAGR